ncbi:PHP domain-containing protein [Soehngenia longivitae]|uniref:PHP domain-containing protein n=1 Tax=Soehngenia longivitae TaxID=2562294 RepID=A0A4Z0D392_9FIRM|nr:PHP domain-containing protein [Soehngenia longivitae]TFZ39798.1 PHP domain-containing protein [Soehngenia longivitae]
MRLFDLHVHTNYSDGIYSVEEIIEKASSKKIVGIAITDHDTIDAIKYIANNSVDTKNIFIVPGIELSADVEGEEIHILGYYLDCENDMLNEKLSILKRDRFYRGLEIIDKLSSLGVEIDKESIISESKQHNNFIGRALIARKLVSEGYVMNIKEAFDKYLAEGKPAFVNRRKLSLEESISLIENANGIPILAHPGIIKNKRVITMAIELGVKGIECFTSKHSKIDEKRFIEYCKANNLIITGGSDYHGDNEILGQYYIDIDKIEAFKNRDFLYNN